MQVVRVRWYVREWVNHRGETCYENLRTDPLEYSVEGILSRMNELNMDAKGRSTYWTTDFDYDDGN